jgi:hypothetical protein
MMNFKKLIAKNPTFRRIVTEEAKRFAEIIKEYEEKTKISEDRSNFPLLRGILSMVFDDERFINTADVRKTLKTLINATGDDVDSMRIALFKYNDENPDKIFDLHKQISKDLMAKNPKELDFKIHPDVNPRQTTGGEPTRQRGGGYWTGD